MKFKKFRMNSIRAKLISGLMAICIIPLTIAAVFSYYQSTSILNNKLEETSGQTLSEINNGLTNYFTALSSQASMMSTQYNFINVEEDQGKNIASLQDVLNSVKGSNQSFASVYYGTETDKFIESPKVDTRKGFIPKERPWYKLAMSNEDKLVITDPYVGKLTGEKMITVAKTVKKDGKIIGVVGMDIVLTNLADTINKSKVGNDGYVYIVDSTGLLLTHPDKSIIGTDTATKLSFWNETKTNDKGFAKYTYNGVKKFGAYEKNELTGWELVASLEESELLKDTNSIKNTQISIIIIFFVIAIIMSLILSNSIVVNMRNLKEAFKKAAKGDLTATVNVKTQDDFKEVGQDFDSMMKNISGLMVEVKESSMTVLDTATTLSSMAIGTRASVGEVSRAIEEVAAGATSQAQNAQDGTSEMNDLSNKIDGISNNSIEMDKISTDTHKLTSKGLGMVKTLIEKSDKTKDSTMQVNKIVQDMNKSTIEINAISDQISQITEQTNLLALNASIEAARAGDAGRGFSVVAEEIRKLAEQSKNSTEEIKKIIENIQSKSLTAVKAMEETENIVEEQDFAVKETQDIFTEILKSISVMIETVTDIKESVVEVNNKKMSVVAQIENISAISQETAASSEEVTASTEEINSTMEEVAELSEQLKTLSEELEQKVSMFTVS